MSPARAQLSSAGRPRTTGPIRARPPVPAASVAPQPPIATRTPVCACGGLCPRCASGQTALKHHDFSAVRIHPAAAEVTAPLRARAVTIGQEVYFHPGEYRPETPEGRRLLAHELAHTLQTRASDGATVRAPPHRESYDDTAAQSDETLEKNADALATGETSQVLAAPARAALRSPFDSESSTDRDRRQHLIRSIDNALGTVLAVLRTGGLLTRVEAAVERGGVRGVAVNVGTESEMFISFAERDRVLRRIVGSLQNMATRYRSTPIPTEFTAPTAEQTGGFTSSVDYRNAKDPEVKAEFTRATPEWADLQGAYFRHLLMQGLLESGKVYFLDGYYLDPSATVTPGAAQGAPRVDRGTPSGAYVVFPDIDNDPLRYWRVDGYTAAPRGSVIVELWHDDFGYFTMRGGQRIDVANPWRTSNR